MPKNQGLDCFVSAETTSDRDFYDYFRGEGVGETTPNFRPDGTPADRLDLHTDYSSLSVKPDEGWDAIIRVGSPEEPYDSVITLPRAQALELARWLQARFG